MDCSLEGQQGFPVRPESASILRSSEGFTPFIHSPSHHGFVTRAFGSSFHRAFADCSDCCDLRCTFRRWGSSRHIALESSSFSERTPGRLARPLPFRWRPQQARTTTGVRPSTHAPPTQSTWRRARSLGTRARHRIKSIPIRVGSRWLLPASGICDSRPRDQR